MEKILVHNSTDKDLELIIEPDGQLFIIAPNLSLEVRTTNLINDTLEVQVRDDDLLRVYGGQNWVYYEDLEIYPNNTHPNWPPDKTNEKKL